MICNLATVHSDASVNVFSLGCSADIIIFMVTVTASGNFCLNKIALSVENNEKRHWCPCYRDDKNLSDANSTVMNCVIQSDILDTSKNLMLQFHGLNDSILIEVRLLPPYISTSM